MARGQVEMVSPVAVGLFFGLLSWYFRDIDFCQNLKIEAVETRPSPSQLHGATKPATPWRRLHRHQWGNLLGNISSSNSIFGGNCRQFWFLKMKTCFFAHFVGHEQKMVSSSADSISLTNCEYIFLVFRKMSLPMDWLAKTISPIVPNQW